MAMMVKNMNGAELAWKLPLRFLMDDVAAVMFLLYGNWRDTLAVFKAHTQFCLHLTHWIKNRRQLKPYKTHQPTTGRYKKGVVFDFFIRKKKTFSSLDV